MDATWWIAIAITLVGGVVSGLAGFGFPLVAVPPLLLIYPPPTVVTISIVLSLLTGWVVLPGAMKHVDRPLVLKLMPWAALGIVVGTLALRSVGTRPVEFLASLTVLVTAAVLLRGKRHPKCLGIWRGREPTLQRCTRAASWVLWRGQRFRCRVRLRWVRRLGRGWRWCLSYSVPM